MIRNTDQQDITIKGSRREKSKRMAWGVVIVVVCSFGGFVVWNSWMNALPSLEKKHIRTDTVVRGELVRDISASGKIVAANAPTLYSPVEGSVHFHLTPGSKVQENQIVAEIKSPSLLNELAQERSHLESLRNQLEREKLKARRVLLQQKQALALAKVNWQAAVREKQRADTSYTSQLISQLDYQKKHDELNRAEVEYQHAQEENQLNKDELSFDIKTRESNLQRQVLIVEELQRKVEELNIRAPVAGILGNWLVEQKSQVEHSQALFVVVDLSAYEVELQVAENYADELSVGQTVQLTINGQEREGELASISPEVSEQQVTTRVRFRNQNNRSLRQNQRVNARILLEHKAGVLIVKRGAFVDAGGRYGYRVNDDVATKAPVTLGGSSLTHVEILSGANVGDTLVISSLDVFKQAEQIALR